MPQLSLTEPDLPIRRCIWCLPEISFRGGYVATAGTPRAAADRGTGAGRVRVRPVAGGGGPVRGGARPGEGAGGGRAYAAADPRAECVLLRRHVRGRRGDVVAADLPARRLGRPRRLTRRRRLRAARRLPRQARPAGTRPGGLVHPGRAVPAARPVAGRAGRRRPGAPHGDVRAGPRVSRRVRRSRTARPAHTGPDRVARAAGGPPPPPRTGASPPRRGAGAAF